MKIGRIFLVVAVSIVISQAIVRDLFAEVPAKQVAGEVRETDDGEIRRPVKPNWTQRHESVSANGSHSASLNGATFRLDPCEGGIWISGDGIRAFSRDASVAVFVNVDAGREWRQVDVSGEREGEVRLSWSEDLVQQMRKGRSLAIKYTHPTAGVFVSRFDLVGFSREFDKVSCMKIFKYVDSKGVLVYTNEPPQGSKCVPEGTSRRSLMCAGGVISARPEVVTRKDEVGDGKGVKSFPRAPLGLCKEKIIARYQYSRRDKYGRVSESRIGNMQASAMLVDGTPYWPGTHEYGNNYVMKFLFTVTKYRDGVWDDSHDVTADCIYDQKGKMIGVEVDYDG